jgi:hypothetical protein
MQCRDQAARLEDGMGPFATSLTRGQSFPPSERKPL